MVLGVSPGTRKIGIAVLDDNGKLCYWQLHTFPESWSETKHKRMLRTITKHMNRYKVRQVAIKIPDELPVSKPYVQLVGSINVVCEMRKIKAQYFTLSEFKQGYFPDRVVTKRELINYLSSQHPEPDAQQQKGQRKNTQYYDKVYEALGVARLTYLCSH